LIAEQTYRVWASFIEYKVQFADGSGSFFLNAIARLPEPFAIESGMKGSGLMNGKQAKENTSQALRGILWVLLGLHLVFIAPLVAANGEDLDLDGYPADIDCDDNNPLWHRDCTLTAYQGCTNELQYANQCLPNVANVEDKLDMLQHRKVDKDKHSWEGGIVRPGDNAPFYHSKRHVQSIQYIVNEPTTASPIRYIVTSMSDEHNNMASIQLVRTKRFADEDGGSDWVAEQQIMSGEVAGFNHPGGSQLIGNYLFLALEDFTNEGDPVTGVWKINPVTEQIHYEFLVPTTDIPNGDHHQATAAVTKLSDGTYLLAACAGEHQCDGINFYKSDMATLESDRESDPPGIPEFTFFYRWERWDHLDDIPILGHYWDDCGPQNMNFIADEDGSIYLVMFGAINEGIPKGFEINGIDVSGCTTGIGYDDHLFAYKVEMAENYSISLTLTNRVDVVPERYICAPLLLTGDPAYQLHGLNFLAGSGLWLRPEGRNTIAYLATEHYDTCGANDRYFDNGEGVRAKTRWGVSTNWNEQPYIDVDHKLVTVNEGDLAYNSGSYYEFGLGNPEVSASIGAIAYPEANSWDWSWQTLDGPDDSQTVTITRSDDYLPAVSRTFELVVENMAPTAVTGPDQIVECVKGTQVSLDATASTDPGLDTLSFLWDFTTIPGSVKPSFDNPASAMPFFQPVDLGSYIAEVTVTDDDSASGTADVLVEYEDTTPPVISGINEPVLLKANNHKMVVFTTSDFVHSVTDACDSLGMEDLQFIKVQSNEPLDDIGDGHSTEDFFISEDGRSVELRAERSGKGDGRSYSLDIQAVDAAGNAVTETYQLIFAHDNKHK
jgi:hypothetical protein